LLQFFLTFSLTFLSSVSQVRLQILPGKNSIVAIGKKILAEEGAKGLYAGLSGA